MTDIDRSDDTHQLCDGQFPVKMHELIANVAWTIRVSAFFLVHIFAADVGGHAIVFCEERFMRVCANSRDFICNRFGIPHKLVWILPYKQGVDTYSDDTKYTQEAWDIILECNEGTRIRNDHFLLVDAEHPWEPTSAETKPRYFFWRSVKNAKTKEGHPVIYPTHVAFTRMEYDDFEKRPLQRRDGSDWYFIKDHDYEDCSEKGLRTVVKRERTEEEEVVPPVEEAAAEE